ncbi:phosphoglycerate kinase isoform X7 [Gossypium hirsutum]|uniref:Phosphoglycerate kinase n=1 Tax=Gossypium hirsutum TaxID=3635 RepID=A0ABM2YQ85_GOSHI|nr:phosphoglycerate kinase isoform X7 [Gossypium hirsutum]
MSPVLKTVQTTLSLNKLSSSNYPRKEKKLLQHGSCSFPINNVQLSFRGELEALPHVQTLREFPREELVAKVVMVRFDSTILLGEKLDLSSQSASKALYTIKYLHECGAKVILMSEWSRKINPKLLDAQAVADILSSVLQLNVIALRCISCKSPLRREDLQKADIFLLENLSEYKEEVANCSKFAELLSSEVDILVNDSFCQSHKVLASTVGVARFCYASMAGFSFEENLHQLKKIAKTKKKPYLAVIGGGNLKRNAAALQFLASRCDALVFVGQMSFQIMSALGHSIPTNLVERDAHKAALDIVQFAHDKNVLMSYPKDFWCTNQHLPTELEVFPAHGVSASWLPVDLGPRSLEEIYSLVTNSKAYPFEIDWSVAYHDASQPLVVDIGSGNGLFIMGMAQNRKDLNFLGLEINGKLVRRCLDSVHQSGIRNAYFIGSNATTTFRSIVSSYPGELVLVSVQCPNPDFNKPENRWSMLQRSLIEAVADLLASKGKVFLQSDVEAVAMRMKEQFLQYGKGKLHLSHDQYNIRINGNAWLEENPFGIHSDWEQHVIDRGAPMYRLMLSKSTGS